MLTVALVDDVNYSTVASVLTREEKMWRSEDSMQVKSTWSRKTLAYAEVYHSK